MFSDYYLPFNCTDKFLTCNLHISRYHISNCIVWQALNSSLDKQKHNHKFFIFNIFYLLLAII